MAPLRYWPMRLIRRYTPQVVAEKMLDWGVLLQPGLDTRAPDQSVAELQRSCAQNGLSLEGKDVCVVGFGGSYGVGVALLEAGVRKVVLQDPYAPLRSSRIHRLGAKRLSRFFVRHHGRWQPDPTRILIVREHLRDYVARYPRSADIVFSSSVLEHVDDVDDLVEACAKLTRPNGLNVHAIDLRDHYFKYPFEMLCYTRRTWQDWLDSSHLNRWRLRDYTGVFGRHFGHCELIVTEALPEEFAKVKQRIRPEFLTGDDAVDSVARVRIEATTAA